MLGLNWKLPKTRRSFSKFLDGWKEKRRENECGYDMCLGKEGGRFCDRLDERE